MLVPAHCVPFAAADGLALSGRVEMPVAPPRAGAVVVHCFTCGKQSRAAVRISRALAGHGFAVLRFDMPGIGESEGDFADSRFASRVSSVVAAAEHLTRTIAVVRLLVGHSLGGTTVIAAADRLPDVQGVATIGAPFDPQHVTGLFAPVRAELAADGEAEVLIAGRRFRVRQEFVDELGDQPQRARLASLGRALLVLHSPTDLAGADHLLTDPADATYAADVIATWAQRYTG